MKRQKEKDATSALKQSEAMAADQFWRGQCKLSQEAGGNDGFNTTMNHHRDCHWTSTHIQLVDTGRKP